ncbi:MAG TPA: TOMM precursor leader peptide-binding protein [Ktedonobacteraceae bacterium]
MLAQSTRLKCKADTCYIPTADGVYLCGNESRLALKGKSLYPLLVHLVPHLNGEITLEELTGELDGDKKRMVMNLLEKLFTHRFLIDKSQNQPHTLAPRELEDYAPNIAFIESFQASAAARFELFRKTHLLLIGSGSALAALIQAGFRCGAGRISAMMMPDGSRQEAAEVLAACASTEVDLLEAAAWEDEAEMRAAIQACDVVLYLAEWPLVEPARLLNRLCVEQRKTLMQALLVDDQAWLGPLVSNAHNGCWECAWRRLQANQPQLADHSAPASAPGRSITGPQAALLASRLLFPVFRHVTGSGSAESAAQVSVLDLTTLLSESHAFLAHPCCLTCQHPVVPNALDFLEQVQRLSQQNPLDPEVFLENVAACVDEHLGLFTTLEAGSFAQAPLAVYQARLSRSADEVDPAEDRAVLAVSIDARHASIQAAQKACERYAARCVDKRRLLSSEAARQAAAPVISASQLLGIGAQTRTQTGEGWTWALDERTRQAVLVPAAPVFSDSERGVASGMTWEEALSQALLDWCTSLTVEQLEDAREPYSLLDLDTVPWTSAGAHLSRLLKATGEPYAVYDVTGPLGVPMFAACLRGRVIAYSAHCDVELALRVGLEQVLRQYQSEVFQQPEYALAAVPDLPEKLRGTRLTAVSYEMPASWSARLEWLLQRLQASGLSAFAVPLDHDPALAKVLPFLVRVLVGRSELEKGA